MWLHHQQESNENRMFDEYLSKGKEITSNLNTSKETSKDNPKELSPVFN